MTNIITVYEVSTDHNVDMGGSRQIEVLGYFTDKCIASEYGKGKGAWGGNCDIAEKQAIEITTTSGKAFYLLGKQIDPDLKSKKADEELKQKTLASLTEDQKRVLGLI